MIHRLAAVLMLMAFRSLSEAKATPEPGQQTVWDQIMAAQSTRDLRRGYEHMHRRRYDAAIKEFAKAVVSNPSEPLGHLMLGSAYYWAGQIPMAEAEFREALRLDPKSAQGHLLMGIVHAWRGEGEPAYEAFQRAAALDPERADIQMNLGSMEETFGQYAKAMSHFRKAVLLEPQNPLYHFQMGMLYRRLGRDSDAIESLRLALKYFPQFEDALLELGAALERSGQNAEALEMFEKAVKLKARDAVARFRLGRAYLLGKDRRRARAVFADAFHLTPEDNQGGLALSVSYGGAPAPPKPGRDGKPPPDFRTQQPEYPQNTTDPLEVLARNLERIPLDQEAQLQVEMAFVPKPKLTRAKVDETPSSLKKALAEAGRARPSAMGVDRQFVLKASDAAGHDAQVRKIVKELRELMRQAPPDTDVRLGMNLRYVKPQEGAASRANSEERPKVSYQPRQVGNDMGLWVMGTGWMALVEEELPGPGEKPQHPDEADWWVSTGLGEAALGNGASALAAFNRAIELNPRDELAWLGRGVAMVESGREEEAVAAYRKALEINPKSRSARDGLKWLMRPAR